MLKYNIKLMKKLIPIDILRVKNIAENLAIEVFKVAEKQNLIVLFIILFLLNTLTSVAFVNDLRTNGYSLIPAPQTAELSGNNIILNNNWSIKADISEDNMALIRLQQGMKEFYGLEFTSETSNKIILEVKKGIVGDEIDEELANQGYQLEIGHKEIRITGNSETGLFYGVQSLLQLPRKTQNSGFSLPEGIITDWPDLELRFIHWDTKHHQDRIETLKRYLDQAALFKINAVGFELEDKFEYPSHPIIGAPGAFTKVEIQELTAYALNRFIQLVPVIQAPSHMAFVLKHEEFAHLKADDNNYHICMCDEEAIELIFDMYQDMIDATPGVDYFFVSTDEVYYAGICNKCEDEYNIVNRSQAWVDYVNRVHAWLAKRNRRMLAWVEYPLLTEDISKLPSGLIDAIMGTTRSKEWINNENKAGIRQLAYSSIQGGELLFPNYFPTNFRKRDIEGRLADASDNVIDVQAMGADLMGTFAAAWDDAGLHNETFWLGWATVTQYGWTANKPSLQQNTADFMDVFYGSESAFMVDIYRMLESGARFYEDIWEQRISTEREPGYGNSQGKGVGTERYDLLLYMPQLPSVADLSRQSDFNEKYTHQINDAAKIINENDRLIDQLMYAITHIERNQYNLEVLLSIAYLERFAINTITKLSKIEAYLSSSAKADYNPSSKVKQLVEAHKLVTLILKEQETTWSMLTDVWEKARFEKCRSTDGKDFTHILDDVKDHFADSRLGLEYMIAPFERMQIREWRNQLGNIIKEYAKANNVAVTGVEIERLED